MTRADNQQSRIGRCDFVKQIDAEITFVQRNALASRQRRSNRCRTQLIRITMPTSQRQPHATTTDARCISTTAKVNFDDSLTITGLQQRTGELDHPRFEQATTHAEGAVTVPDQHSRTALAWRGTARFDHAG